MSSPFSFAGSFQLPADVGLEPDAIAISTSGQFDSENKQVLRLTGSGTIAVPMGTVPLVGLKGLLIKVDANPTGDPIEVTVNSSSHPIEISPGGFFAFGSPDPTAGITAISIAYTTANKVRLWAIG